ncbi:MAG: type II toxin-antitoxin system VapC family toxin [Terriglobales bacterium]
MLLDTSALLAVLLDEPSRPALIRVTQGQALRAAPTLPWELGNALVAGFRRHRLSAEEVRAAWASFGAVPVQLVEVSVPRALDLALAAGVYAYDGYVLEAARHQRLALLTLDRALARAAARLGLATVEVDLDGI